MKTGRHYKIIALKYKDELFYISYTLLKENSKNVKCREASYYDAA